MMLQTTDLIETTVPNTGYRDAGSPMRQSVVPGVARHNVTYRAQLAISDKVRQDAYRLRYRSYLAAGYIERNDTGLFLDRYDNMRSSSTVVIYDGDRAVASVRTCLLARGTDLTSPALDTFPKEVQALLDSNPDDSFAGRAIEATRLVRSPEAENNQGLVFLLYRMAGYVALCAHSQVHLACVRANHVPFYRRLGYTAASEPRFYPGLSCKMQLMASDRRRYDEVRASVPMMDPLGGTTRKLEGFFAGEPVLLTLTR